jgi:hypothetical protein
MFVTVLSVPINHEYRDSTPYLFNDAFTGYDFNNKKDSIRKAPVTTGLQFDATYWPLLAVTQVTSSAPSSYQKPNPEPPNLYVLST